MSDDAKSNVSPPLAPAPRPALRQQLRDMAIRWRENRCAHTGDPDPTLEPYSCPQCVADALEHVLPLLEDAAALREATAAPLDIEMELQIAERIARQAHLGQTEESTGDDYIHHIERVVGLVDDDRAKAVAWLHDVLEDTTVMSGDLCRAGISDDVRAAVERLTRGGEPYHEYISTIRVCGPDLARLVKIADLRDHLRPNCPERLRPRYERALAALTLPAALGEAPAPPGEGEASVHPICPWCDKPVVPGTSPFAKAHWPCLGPAASLGEAPAAPLATSSFSRASGDLVSLPHAIAGPLTCTACSTVVAPEAWTGACPRCGNGTMREALPASSGARPAEQNHD